LRGRRVLSRRLELARRVELLDQLDLRPLKNAVQVFDARLVELQLGDRPSDLGVGQNAELPPASDQRRDLIKLLKILDRHPLARHNALPRPPRTRGRAP
jgi:hypothetical protein